jgi:hypothetical protein
VFGLLRTWRADWKTATRVEATTSELLERFSQPAEAIARHAVEEGRVR